MNRTRLIRRPLASLGLTTGSTGVLNDAGTYIPIKFFAPG